MRYTPEELGRLMYEVAQVIRGPGQLGDCEECLIWEVCQNWIGILPCEIFAGVLENLNEAAE